MNLIEAKDISVSLGGRVIVDHVSLAVGKGEMVGLIGPNGAGKSTLMKTLVRILRFQSGSIDLMGQPIHRMDRKILARKLAYLPQGQEVHWPLAVERVVALGRIPYLMPWQDLSDFDDQKIREAMTCSDVLPLARRQINQLAGGEKALVMLARALASEPEVILADEPVAGLDPNHQIQVMQLLKDLAGKGRGIIVVLHNLTLAARFCKQLFLMREGKIYASGDPQAVLKPENLKVAYGIDARYGHYEGEFFIVPWQRI
ncbi:MAG: ABC transporter ATP-binding protein [Candidatus Omnitrophica bacterium]|nr:ABC transporter ATP-binding protein [Candidatus Omnitrophota bacterium]